MFIHKQSPQEKESGEYR